jgi:coenzyme F420-reducing hydrogenase delta subunit/biotin operon repressor
MCSGRLDAKFVLEGFLHGVDGVLVVGCHLEDCHYSSGNHEALKMIRIIKAGLACAGVEPERLRFEFVSAAEGAKFAGVVDDFVAAVRELGPLGLSSSGGRNRKLSALCRGFDQEGLKWILGKLEDFAKKGNLYGEVLTQHELTRLLEQATREKIREQEILLTLEKEAPLSVRTIAEQLMMPSDDVLKYIYLLKKKGLVTMSAIEGRTPLYAAETHGTSEI